MWTYWSYVHIEDTSEGLEDFSIIKLAYLVLKKAWRVQEHTTKSEVLS